MEFMAFRTKGIDLFWHLKHANGHLNAEDRRRRMQWSLFSVKCFIITCWPALFWNKVILTGAPNTRLFLDSFILLLIALALIIARDQFEGTFVTIIRSLRLTFTFSVKKIYIGTFFGWCALFWFFVVWIKLLSNQIHISQVLESLRPISQMINIPFMPEILWDETFFAFLVCNYYQTEGGDKCQ